MFDKLFFNTILPVSAVIFALWGILAYSLKEKNKNRRIDEYEKQRQKQKKEEQTRQDLQDARTVRNGEKYKKLQELNMRVLFETNILDVYCIDTEVDSKTKLDRFDFEKFLAGEFSRDYYFFLNIMEKALKNREQQKLYDARAKAILGEKIFREAKEGNNQQKKSVEARMLGNLLVRPVLYPRFKCSVSYTSPQGRKSYSRKRDFDIFELERIKRIVDTQINVKSSKEHERSAMSNSLRYDIMKRDGFRCVLCGRSSRDGVKLEVDHIIPVAKGGKTVAFNLRTLCENCNRGKRDKYDPNGEN